jgi:hypothetical protein
MVAFNLFINWLKFADGGLYKANILKLDDLVSSSTAQPSSLIYTVKRGINFVKALILCNKKYTFFLSVGFGDDNCNLGYNPSV